MTPAAERRLCTDQARQHAHPSFEGLADWAAHFGDIVAENRQRNERPAAPRLSSQPTAWQADATVPTPLSLIFSASTAPSLLKEIIRHAEGYFVSPGPRKS